MTNELPRQLLGFARAAYYGREQLTEHLSAMGGELLLYVDDCETGTQGYVARTVRGRIVIAFRGTEPTCKADLKTDLDRTLIHDEVSGGKVHAGFLRAANAIEQHVLEAIDARPGLPVQITGHSLGAALATILVHRIAVRRSDRVIACVQTFGSPRVGDAAFAASYNRRLHDITWRHVNCCDIVTRVPGYWHGYRHVGQQVYYDSLGNEWDDAGPLYTLADRIMARYLNWGRLPTAGIRHHLLASYYNVLEG